MIAALLHIVLGRAGMYGGLLMAAAGVAHLGHGHRTDPRALIVAAAVVAVTGWLTARQGQRKAGWLPAGGCTACGKSADECRCGLVGETSAAGSGVTR